MAAVRASAERIRQDIETIAGFSSSGPGTNRLSFTPEYWAAVDYVAAQMAALEAETARYGTFLGLPAKVVLAPAVSAGP